MNKRQSKKLKKAAKALAAFNPNTNEKQELKRLKKIHHQVKKIK